MATLDCFIFGKKFGAIHRIQKLWCNCYQFWDAKVVNENHAVKIAFISDKDCSIRFRSEHSTVLLLCLLRNLMEHMLADFVRLWTQP